MAKVQITKRRSCICLAINHKSSTSYIPLNIKVEENQWDKNKLVINHPSKTFYNTFIRSKQLDAERILLELMEHKNISSLSVSQLKDKIKNKLDGKDEECLFLPRFEQYMNTRDAKSTRRIYGVTLTQMQRYDKQLAQRTLDSINKDWLVGFVEYLKQKGNKVNTISINLRNIRAVFNDAIDNELTNNYPFRKFKIKNEETKKRNLTIEQVHELWKAEVPQWIRPYLDMFKLSFYLIGINISDLLMLKEIGADGYIEYRRNKTHKIYRIKVEPEALEIIKKYRGKNYLLNVLDKYADVHDYDKYINKALKAISCTPDGITTYWARHTWASLASEIDIPIDTISHALGHSMGNKTTAIYINYNSKKIDDANRRVIDYVLTHNET